MEKYTVTIEWAAGEPKEDVHHFNTINEAITFLKMAQGLTSIVGGSIHHPEKNPPTLYFTRGADGKFCGK